LAGKVLREQQFDEQGSQLPDQQLHKFGEDVRQAWRLADKRASPNHGKQLITVMFV